MVAFLAEWGVELILGLIASGVTGFFAWKSKQLKKELDKAEQFDKAQAQQNIENTIETKIQPLKEEHQLMDAEVEKKIQPLYEELENLREYARTTRIENESMKKLLIDSWKYRLKVLCQTHIEHGRITMKQLDQLQEFFRCYSELGGNGQAKELYEIAIKLPIAPPSEDDE